jgi:hypothetical protein
MAKEYGGLPSDLEARATAEEVDQFIAMKNAEARHAEKEAKRRNRPAGSTLGPDLLSRGG